MNYFSKYGLDDKSWRSLDDLAYRYLPVVFVSLEQFSIAKYLKLCIKLKYETIISNWNFISIRSNWQRPEPRRFIARPPGW